MPGKDHQSAQRGGMSLEARLARLEAIEDIRRLKARYCELCDDGYPGEQLSRLFTDDAIWDGGDLGRYEGRAAIREFFDSVPATLSMAIHHVTNPLITVSSDASSAEARWYLLQTATTADGGALWFAGRYEDAYVRLGGDWLFSHVAIKARFVAPYEKGWGSRGGTV